MPAQAAPAAAAARIMSTITSPPGMPRRVCEGDAGGGDAADDQLALATDVDRARPGRGWPRPGRPA